MQGLAEHLMWKLVEPYSFTQKPIGCRWTFKVRPAKRPTPALFRAGWLRRVFNSKKAYIYHHDFSSRGDVKHYSNSKRIFSSLQDESGASGRLVLISRCRAH